jgi:putative acetyltransferase
VWAATASPPDFFRVAMMRDDRTVSVDGSQPPEQASAAASVRDMRSGEAAAVRSLVLAGLAEHWGSVDPSLNPDLDDLAAAHPGSRTLVAVDPAGTIVGTGTIVPRGTGTAEVVRMSVATARRGTGVGRQVLDALVEVAQSWGVHRLVLETTADWSGTVAFYERCGFRITHHEDGEFGRDAWFERRL